jgi:hypothetical protein
MAPTVITELPVSVDRHLKQLIRQRAELLYQRGGSLDQHHTRVWHREAGVRILQQKRILIEQTPRRPLYLQPRACPARS